MTVNLHTPVKDLPRVGPQYAQKLSRLGIESVEHLLFYFPRRYDDFSHITPISQAHPGQLLTIKGQILQIGNKRTARKRMTVTEAVVTDDSGSIKAVWFNQPFLTKNLKAGTDVILAGKFEWNYGQLALQSPAYERVPSGSGNTDVKHVGRIVPVYPETEGLTSRWLRPKIKPLLKLTDGVADYLPEEVKESNGLISLPSAIKQIHFPDSDSLLKKARYRLSFDELFLLHVSRFGQKKEWQKAKAPAIEFDEEFARAFVKSLPFQLTQAQRKAAWEILQDLQKDMPMNRLLEGDVGSGKTIVAALAMATVAKSGFQTALMCPTEVLARQHYHKIAALLDAFDIEVVLLAGSTKESEKTELIERIQNGEIQVLVGTHTLIQEKIRFKNLGLAVVDEQHRFGVRQRQALRERNASEKMPHFLSMTATPIPRTLALTVFGDLDISLIDEMPPGRQKIVTALVPPGKRKAAYQFVREQILEGRQAFVICPLIEESDHLGVRSVTDEYEKLSRQIFPDFKIGLLHGRLKASEKEEVMKGFAQNELSLLVSTSVVEVGIDVPNASIMMIEGAERFGLAQLHQFRGRVGRGEHKSYCFLFTDSRSEGTTERLQALVNTDDGFELAQKDLELRGPGEIYGTQQHGLPEFKMANLLDGRLIKKTREEAEKIIQKDAFLELPEHRLLFSEVKKKYSQSLD
jgi:ATP-dependent DNA helicase RecG